VQHALKVQEPKRVLFEKNIQQYKHRYIKLGVNKTNRCYIAFASILQKQILYSINHLTVVTLGRSDNSKLPLDSSLVKISLTPVVVDTWCS
jgi:hypothetical protein